MRIEIEVTKSSLKLKITRGELLIISEPASTGFCASQIEAFEVGMIILVRSFSLIQILSKINMFGFSSEKYRSKQVD